MKFRKRLHHSHNSSLSNPHNFSFRTLERFLLNYGLGIAGVILLLSGLIFLVINHYGNDTVLSLIKSFLKSGTEEPFNPISQDFPLALFFSLSFLYLPGLISLILPYFIGSGKAFLKNSFILFGLIWLIFAEGKIFLYNAYHNGSFFPGFYSALIYFSIIQLILIIISTIYRSRFALNLSVVFFFISVALIRSYFGGLVPFFLILIFFQITIFFLSLKFRWRSPFVTTILLSGCYLIFYILRKIIFAENPQPVSYMLPSLLFWFVISLTGLAILKPTTNRKTISLLWNIVSYISAFLVVGLTAYMIKLSGINYFYPLSTTIIILVLVLIAVLNERYGYLKSKKPFYFSLCIFCASLVPQLLFSNFLLLLAGSLSVTFLFHANLVHSRFSLNLSKVFFLIMLSLYLIEWAFGVIPALIDQTSSGQNYPLHVVLVNVLIASISFFYVRLFSYSVREHPSFQIQTRIPSNIAETVLPFIIYSSCFLILNFALITIFHGYRLSLTELAMFAYAFLWFFFHSKPSDSRATLIFRTVVSILVIALYPVIIHPEVIENRNLFLEGNTIAFIPFVLHFITLGLIILLLFQANGFLRMLFRNIHEISHYFKLIMVILITFILLTEYDNFSLFWFNHISDVPVNELLRSNKFVPYSVLLLSFSILLLIYSLILYSRFLRRVSLLMIILVILKIFIIDLKILTANTIVILLISVGLILLGLAFIIRKLRNKRNSLHRKTSSEVSTPH